jgi:hypothetical protein
MFEGIRSLLKATPARSSSDEKLDQALANAQSLDHYFFFPTQADLDAAASSLEQRGWTIVSVTLDGTEKRYLLHARRQGRAENLQELQNELDLFADDHHGEYDGWQVTGMTEDL